MNNNRSKPRAGVALVAASGTAFCVATAPALEDLALIAMPHLVPDDLRTLGGHPTLRRGHWNIGSLRKTYQAHDVLPVDPEPFGYAEWRAGVPYRELRSAFSEALLIGMVEVDGRMVLRRDSRDASPQWP